MNPDLPSLGWLPTPGWLSLDWFNRLVDDIYDAARSSLLDRDPEAVDADGHLIENLITVCSDGTITQILNRSGHHFGEGPLPALLFLAGQAAVAIVYSTEVELPDHTRGLVVFGTWPAGGHRSLRAAQILSHGDGLDLLDLTDDLTDLTRRLTQEDQP